MVPGVRVRGQPGDHALSIGYTVQGLTPSAEALGQNVKTAVRRAEPSIEVMLEAKGHTVQGLTPRAEASEDTCKDDGVKG